MEGGLGTGEAANVIKLRVAFLDEGIRTVVHI